MDRQDMKLMIDRLTGIDCDTTDSHTIDDAITMLEELGGEVDALRIDAERYRWLRRECGFGISGESPWSGVIRFRTVARDGRDMDGAIDAAMSNVGGEARLAAHRPSQTTTATPQGVASTDELERR